MLLVLHALVIVGKNNIIIGNYHQPALENGFGKSGQHTELRMLIGDREIAGFPFRLFFKISRTFHAVAESAVCRITPCGSAFYTTRLKQIARMEQATLTIVSFLLFQVDGNHVFGDAGLHIEVVHVGGIAVPYHFGIVEATSVAHQ